MPLTKARPESSSPEFPKGGKKLQLVQKTERSSRRVSGCEAELASRPALDDDKRDQPAAPEKREEPEIVSPDWEMFENVCILGEGAYGTVYKVKSLRTSIIGGDGARVALDQLPKKYKA